MKYELALQLKDADFPNLGGGIGERYIYPEPGYLGLSRSQACYDPTLSELIEECGEGFGELVRSNNYITKPMWLAYPSKGALNKSDNDCVLDCCGYEIGSTPEEAVVNLWLALNNK